MFDYLRPLLPKLRDKKERKFVLGEISGIICMVLVGGWICWLVFGGHVHPISWFVDLCGIWPLGFIIATMTLGIDFFLKNDMRRDSEHDWSYESNIMLRIAAISAYVGFIMFWITIHYGSLAGPGVSRI